ncbi:DUF4241 domain-containing protein [Hymenobacter arcticus]
MQTITRLFSAAEGPGVALLSDELPPLWLPTGRLVACDPAAHAAPLPFAHAVAPGAYPVFVHRAPDYDYALAYAELRVRPAPAVRWEMALTAGQDAATLGPEELFGYPVDTGLGCFLDAQTLVLLPAHEAALAARLGVRSANYYDHFLAPALSRAAPGRRAATLPLYPGEPANLAVFEAGEGDGYYATYVGLDAAGQPVRFVTEFLDVDEIWED